MKNKNYLIAFLPGFIALTLEFFTKELMLSGIELNTISRITSLFWGISIGALITIYLCTKERK